MPKFITANYRDRQGFDGYPQACPSDLIQVPDDYIIEAPWYETTEEKYLSDREPFLAAVIAENERLEAIKIQHEADIVEFTKAEAAQEIEALKVHVETVDAGQITQQDRNETVDTLAKFMLRYAPILEQLRIANGDTVPTEQP